MRAISGIGSMDREHLTAFGDVASEGDTDDAIVRAIGRELRRARDSMGWSRPDLVKRMHTNVPVNTLAGYEQGIRQVSIPRLVEICRALGVAAPEVLSLALQRAEIDLATVGVRVDLRKILTDDRPGLLQLRQWAEHRLHRDADGSGVAKLEWELVGEMAAFFGVPASDLVKQLQEFAPESVPRREELD
jgi:transcriptional regulator with XRE-family HTH domain